MADVFLSYARADTEAALAIKSAVEALGLTVFFDTDNLDGGEEWPDALDRELKSAGAVLAVWSAHALSRPWVKRECFLGQQRQILVPVQIEIIPDLDKPAAFATTQFTDLSNWNGDLEHPEWRKTVRALAKVLNRRDILQEDKRRAEIQRREAAEKQRQLDQLRRLERSHAALKQSKGGMTFLDGAIGVGVAIAVAVGAFLYSGVVSRDRMVDAAMTDELRAAMATVDVDRELRAREILSDVIDEASLGQLMQVSALDGGAALMAGWAYKFGLGGVTQNYTESARLFAQSCELRNYRGCRNLGVQYSLGEGVEIDHDRAHELYAKACEGGDMRGCNNLGVQAIFGMGGPLNAEIAAQFFSQACEGGDPRGCKNLGDVHAGAFSVQTEPVAADFASANSLYDRACTAGDGMACNSLAVQYLEGKGVAASPATALDLLERACADHVYVACHNAGRILLDPRHAFGDLRKARTLFATACDGGDSRSCATLEQISAP